MATPVPLHTKRADAPLVTAHGPCQKGRDAPGNVCRAHAGVITVTSAESTGTAPRKNVSFTGASRRSQLKKVFKVFIISGLRPASQARISTRSRCKARTAFIFL